MIGIVATVPQLKLLGDQGCSVRVRVRVRVSVSVRVKVRVRVRVSVRVSVRVRLGLGLGLAQVGRLHAFAYCHALHVRVSARASSTVWRVSSGTFVTARASQTPRSSTRTRTRSWVACCPWRSSAAGTTTSSRSLRSATGGSTALLPPDTTCPTRYPHSKPKPNP